MASPSPICLPSTPGPGVLSQPCSPSTQYHLMYLQGPKPGIPTDLVIQHFLPSHCPRVRQAWALAYLPLCASCRSSMPTPPLLKGPDDCTVYPGTLAFLILWHGNCSRTRLIWAVPLLLSTASHALQGQASSLTQINPPFLPTPSSQPTYK